ncbi:MAG: glycosyltransferase family 2 protein [Candidatus Binatia bacterium]
MKLSVVIPARNEEGTVGETVDAIRARLESERIDWELVVVDDGSTDGTPGVVGARGVADPRVRLVSNPGPHGFGHAVRVGLDAFTGDAVVIMMADGSDAPDDLVRYYYVLRDQAECAFGSRFVRGGRTERYPRFKLAVNRLANTLVRLLFGLRYNDVTNAFKGYRATVIQGCRPLLAAHFNLTVELPLKAIVRGYSYQVLPISWRQRKAGVSSLKLQEMGSRYLFIVLYVLLERLLSRGDYRRAVGERFEPFPRPVPSHRPDVHDGR